MRKGILGTVVRDRATSAINTIIRSRSVLIIGVAANIYCIVVIVVVSETNMVIVAESRIRLAVVVIIVENTETVFVVVKQLPFAFLRTFQVFIIADVGS